jgi:hypothetical protein
VAPYAHAASVLHLEQVLRLDPEIALNRWLAAHHVIGWWVASYYDMAHYAVTFGMIAWLWWRRPELYRSLRTSLALVNIFGFVVFWCYPMAPPRLTPGRGFVDIVTTTHAFGSYHTGRLAQAANELAAMPSLHISWAVWSALAFHRMFRTHRWAKLAWAYPLLTAVSVLATGNHFLADILAGALVLIIAVLIAERWYPAAKAKWTTALARRSAQATPDGDSPEPTAPRTPARERRPREPSRALAGHPHRVARQHADSAPARRNHPSEQSSRHPTT